MKTNRIRGGNRVALRFARHRRRLRTGAMVNGEVKKIDETTEITLKYGSIKNLDMEEDSMTMVFRVQDPAMLKQIMRQGPVPS
jgi:Cu/Ag efflux protein CusF